MDPTGFSARARFPNGNTSGPSMLPQPVTLQRLAFPKKDHVWWRFRKFFPLGSFFCAAFSISLCIFLVFLSVTWATVVRDATLSNRLPSLETPGLLIFGDGFQLDLETRSLSVQWSVLACDVFKVLPYRTPNDIRLLGDCEPFAGAFDLYLNDPTTPVFSYAPQEPTGEPADAQPSFTAEHRIHKYGPWDPVKRLNIPFDRYSFSASAFAVDPATNQSLPIAMFIVSGTPGDFILHSRDTVSKTKFVYFSGDGFVTSEIESRLLQADIMLSTIAKVFAVCLTLANWSLAVGSIYVTLLVAFGGLEINCTLLTVPFSAPVTIPAIRSLYISHPPFGSSIDAVAFFVQLSTVSMCSFILLKFLAKR